MKLYNIKTKEIEDLDLILIDDNQMYADKLTKEELLEAGYKAVKHLSESFTIKDKYKTTTTEITETEYEYKIIESIVDVEPAIAKINKHKELQIWALTQTKRCKINIKDFGEVDGGYNYITNAEALINNYDLLPQKLFRMYDNSFKEVTKEQLLNVKKAIELAGIKIHQLKWNYEQEIEKASTTEQVKNINFTDVIDIEF